jgi:hypothetical protein
VLALALVAKNKACLLLRLSPSAQGDKATMLDPEARVRAEAEAAAKRALHSGMQSTSTTTPTFGTAGDPAEAERCRELVSKALDQDEKVHTLREALTKLGVATGNMVHCDHCPDGLAAAGGYVPSERRVVLCQQWATKMPTEVSNTLAHELVRRASTNAAVPSSAVQRHAVPCSAVQCRAAGAVWTACPQPTPHPSGACLRRC